tara:strand:- start:1364 stop:1675 length:312 start_codon:yes stop_codon:yes gene_type:complete
MRIKDKSRDHQLCIDQNEWLPLVDLIDTVYEVLGKEHRDNLRYGYGKTLGYPEVDKLATALEQFLEDNEGLERVETDAFHTVEVKRVKDFISYIRLAQEIKVY